MGKLSKSSKALIGFIIFLIVAFLIYVAIAGVIGSKRETVEGTDQTFGAVELPLNSELTGLGLDNSIFQTTLIRNISFTTTKLIYRKRQ